MVPSNLQAREVCIQDRSQHHVALKEAAAICSPARSWQRVP
jgi:hypothetical protein